MVNTVTSLMTQFVIQSATGRPLQDSILYVYVYRCISCCCIVSTNGTYLPLIVLSTSIAELQNEVQAITAEYRQEQADHKQVQHVRKREG